MVSTKFKKLLIEIVGSKCEMCSDKVNLTIHRIRRGHKGGLYEHRNCKVLCSDCHKLIHGGEFT